MKHSVYDQAAAKRLIPLLHSIALEIRERATIVADLEGRHRAMTNPKLTDARTELEAELSIQRRELRHAHQELETLGCTMDANDPTRVRIPGADGALESGFTWNVDQELLAPCTA